MKMCHIVLIDLDWTTLNQMDFVIMEKSRGKYIEN